MDYVDCAECIAIVIFPYENDEESALVIEALLSEPNVRISSLSSKRAELYIGRVGDYVIKLPTCDFWRNELCIREDDKAVKNLILYTRENPRDAGLSVKSLLSNKLHGVDNTGNICVWPAEPLLLHTLLNVRKFTEMVRDKRVLEIGGGMTALAGLGLAVAGICASIAVTDGHPDCVANQNVCIAMSKQEHATKETNALPSHPLNITSQVLHWSPAVNAEQVASLTKSHSQLFEVVIASDCLFFKDFHADLLHTLQQLLVPGGVGLFLQPARDKTLYKFVALCTDSGAFTTEIIEDYSPQVSGLRAEYLEKKEALGYVEDIHYPTMLIIRRK
eukprot:gene15890-18151_t